MQASGLLESIKIHTSGYEFREDIESFVGKFWPITLTKVSAKVDDHHITFGGAASQITNSESNIMPGSLEDYVTKIFANASKGDPSSPVHFSQN